MGQQIMDILMQLSNSVAQLAGQEQDAPPDSWNWPQIFPGYNPDQGWPPLETRGQHDRPRPLPDPGQNGLHRREDSEAAAVARRRASQSADPGQISDGEADSLFAPRTDAEARHRAREIAAGKILDYDDNELNAILFGDHTFAPGEED